MKKALLFATLGCAVLATSCQEEEMGFTQQEVYHSAYQSSFNKTFGNVDPGQNWDFTTRAKTAYESIKDPTTGYYEVEGGTLRYLQRTLPENKNNSSVATRFSLTTTEATTFEIAPIYIGQAQYIWDVQYVIVDANGQESDPITVWTKGQDGIQVATRDSTNVGTWRNPVWEYSEWRWSELGPDVINSNWNHNYNVYVNTEKAAKVRSVPVRIDVPASSTLYFVINNNGPIDFKPYSSTGTSKDTNPSICCLSDCPIPSNIATAHPDYDFKIIGCEGYRKGDTDFNEVAFLLAGYVPQVIYNDKVTVETSTKRYMMEDMGSIDWDFNDVVVDVTTTTRTQYLINTDTGEATVKPGTTPSVAYSAVIAHLGGTYPVQVTVGTTALPLISDPTNHEQTNAELAGNSATHTYGHNGTSNGGWEPSSPTFTITGYTPAGNNVSLTVYKDYDASQKVNSESVWTSTFPELGAVPYIIATDPTDDWTTEGVGVDTKDWWKQRYPTTTIK